MSDPNHELRPAKLLLGSPVLTRALRRIASKDPLDPVFEFSKISYPKRYRNSVWGTHLAEGLQSRDTIVWIVASSWDCQFNGNVQKQAEAIVKIHAANTQSPPLQFKRGVPASASEPPRSPIVLIC